VRLEQPTDLAVNPLDNSLYVLDNNVVLQITEAGLIRMVAGRPDHCPTPTASDPVRTTLHSALEYAKAIIVSHQGKLYITQTDDRKVNRIQEVNSNGEMSVITGTISECDCKIDPDCECFS
ncbi:teneurin-1 isoform X1, partial [Tachysurus ichikawai]